MATSASSGGATTDGGGGGAQRPDWQALLLAGDPTARECERSTLVNEETVYLIFQLELDTQLQRALNYESYEAAQAIRQKRETVGCCFGCCVGAAHVLSPPQQPRCIHTYTSVCRLLALSQHHPLAWQRAQHACSGGVVPQPSASPAQPSAAQRTHATSRHAGDWRARRWIWPFGRCRSAKRLVAAASRRRPS